MESGEKDMISSIWGLNENRIFATGNGVVIYFDGRSWKSVVSGYPTYFEQIHGSSLDNLYAVGRGGLLVHYDGQDWKKIEIPTNLSLNTVFTASRERVVLAGVEGIVLQGQEGVWEVIQFEGLDFVDVHVFDGETFLAASGDGLFVLKDKQLICIRDDIKVSRLRALNGKLYAAGGMSIHSFDGIEWKRYDYTIS